MTTLAIILAAALAWVWLTPRSVGRSGGRRVGDGWVDGRCGAWTGSPSGAALARSSPVSGGRPVRAGDLPIGGGRPPVGGGRVLLRLWQVIGRLRGTSRAGTRTVDNAVVLDLAAAALGSGMSIPGMLKALDVATGGAAPRDGSGGERTRAANMLLMGARWDEAWEGLGQERLREALRAAWTDGAAPVPLIERSAQSLRLRRQRNAKEAAAKLGARLVMPLGLCFLPAFILVGIVPVVAGAAGSLF